MINSQSQAKETSHNISKVLYPICCLLCPLSTFSGEEMYTKGPMTDECNMFFASRYSSAEESCEA